MGRILISVLGAFWVLFCAVPSARAMAPRAQVVGAKDGTEVQITARHGRLDTYINIEVQTDGEDEVEVQVAISDAQFGNENVPLNIFLAQRSEEPTTIVTLPRGLTAVGIRGHGFELAGLYQARISFSTGDEQLGAYHLDIVSEDPYAPLGLRASELRPPRLTDQPLCLPVDADREDKPPIRVAVGPSAGGELEGSRSLPTDISVAFTNRCAGDQVELSAPSLEPGLYSGAVEVNGEPLEVRLTILQPWWLVMALVALGAGMSIASRDLVQHARQRAANEEAIANAEAQIDRRPTAAFVLDDLLPRNAIRAARAENRLLRMAAVKARLAPALSAPAGGFSSRPEYAEIRNALEDAQLPTVNAVLWRIQQMTRLSSRQDEAELDRELKRLAAEAKRGFPGVFEDWLTDMRRDVQHLTDDARDALESEAWTGRTRALIERAANTLEQYLVDAERVALPVETGGDGRLEPLQLALVERTVHAARTLADIAAAGPEAFEAETVEGIIFGTLPDPEDLDPKRGETLPANLDLVLVGGTDSEGRAVAGQECHFELRGAPDALRGWVSYTWYIDAGTHITPGGPRLTWVFPDEGEHDVEVVAVARGRVAQAHFIWSGPVVINRTRAVQARTWRWIAEKGATAVGVVIAGAIAVALVWSERSYGDWADYVALLATGLGVEIGIGTGPTLVRNVLDAFRGRRRDDPDEEPPDDS